MGSNDVLMEGHVARIRFLKATLANAGLVSWHRVVVDSMNTRYEYEYEYEYEFEYLWQLLQVERTDERKNGSTALQLLIEC